MSIDAGRVVEYAPQSMKFVEPSLDYHVGDRRVEVVAVVLEKNLEAGRYCDACEVRA